MLNILQSKHGTSHLPPFTYYYSDCFDSHLIVKHIYSNPCVFLLNAYMKNTFNSHQDVLLTAQRNKYLIAKSNISL